MKIQICMWNGCKEKYSEYILQRLERDKERFELNNVIISTCSCLDNCKKWPVVMFDKHIEGYMTPTKASKMMMDKIKWNKPKKKDKVVNKNEESNGDYYLNDN
jgi:NADH:ubiquinone oxidoreductase subunit E